MADQPKRRPCKIPMSHPVKQAHVRNGTRLMQQSAVPMDIKTPAESTQDLESFLTGLLSSPGASDPEQ